MVTSKRQRHIKRRGWHGVVAASVAKYHHHGVMAWHHNGGMSGINGVCGVWRISSMYHQHGGIYQQWRRMAYHGMAYAANSVFVATSAQRAYWWHLAAAVPS